jgi:predicted membrane protein
MFRFFTRRRVIAALVSLPLASSALAQGKKGGEASPVVSSTNSIAGNYASAGLNADGTSYAGNVAVIQQGDAVDMTWTVGKDVIHGTGQIEGRVVTVDWGSDSPVIYVIMPNGELHGTWDNGRALEKMTPQ